MAPILTVQDLGISFGNNHVLKSINFTLEENEILGVIGPNGAGKTVLLNILTGILKPTKGAIVFDGQNLVGKSINDRVYMGIGRTFQIPRAFEKMSAYENVVTSGVFGASLNERNAGKQAMEILEMISLGDKALTMAGKLGLLDRKRLEIGMALASQARLLLFDEVAGGLTASEVSDILEIVKRIKAEGCSVIWIEHVIQTMLKGTDRVLLLADGRDILTGIPAEVMASPEVKRFYLGVKKNNE